MKPLAAVLLVLLACSPGDTSASTTTMAAQPSTSQTAATTTTTSTTPTTQPEESTTSTVDSTTTTVTPGNWADEPLVVAGFGALGWWDGADWVQVGELTELPVVGGEDYQVAVLGPTTIITGSVEELVCEPLLNPGVTLEDEELLGEWPGPYGVAISAPWELTPHLVQSLADDGTYAAFAAQVLAERGLTVGNPVIKQLLRVDLEGDGVNEVIVVAEDVSFGLLPNAGDYSIAFMRKVVHGEVQTSILGESVITDPDGAFLIGYSIGAVADLSGDGRMEVVVDAAYYEGLGVEVWEYVNDDIGMTLAIQTGCGA